jgi:lipopolysaccharide biosynthesis glycosyltransferase
VFDEYFKQWEQALFLDCDIVVQDDLERLFRLLETDETKIWMDTEDGSTMETFWRDTNKEQNKDVYELMREKYPHVDKQTFNSSVMLFKPEYIDSGVPQTLIEIQEEVKRVNSPENLGTDQQIINLLLWNQSRKIPNKLVCFWGLAEPQNDVDSEWRLCKKGDIPVAIHLSRWYSQWIKKTPDADAYLNRKLNIPNYDLYHQNLLKFI